MARDLSTPASFSAAQRGTLRDIQRQLDELPKGIVASGTPQGIVALPAFPTVIDLTDTITFTLVKGRRYRLVFSARAAQASAGSTWRVALLVDGAVPTLSDHYFDGERAYGASATSWPLAGDGVKHTFKVQGSAAAGTVSLHAQPGDYAAEFYLEDKGVA